MSRRVTGCHETSWGASRSQRGDRAGGGDVQPDVTTVTALPQSRLTDVSGCGVERVPDQEIWKRFLFGWDFQEELERRWTFQEELERRWTFQEELETMARAKLK